MKTLFFLNICLFIAALVGGSFAVRSHYATTAKYAEFERAGCVNESALLEFSKGRFRPDYRQDIALWIAQPAQSAAKTNAVIALVIATLNLIVVGILLLKHKPFSS